MTAPDCLHNRALLLAPALLLPPLLLVAGCGAATPADPKQPEAKSAPAPAADAGEERLRRMEERMEELRRELERERETRKQKPADA